MKVSVKIQVASTDVLPGYKSKDAAGCDLYNNGDAVRLLPGERATIMTGVKIQLPKGYEAQVRGRSGLNSKYGLVVPTGTIDSDYRGEIGVVIYNLSREPYVILSHDRIAQLVISPVVQASWELSDELDYTPRNTKGFGSTGK